MSWLESHAISPQLAQAIGVSGEMGQDIRFPYGRQFFRIRKPDGKVMQPPNVPLELWWPLGKQSARTVLLCEGEGDTLAALSVLCDDKGEPRDLPDGPPTAVIPEKGLPPTNYESLRGVCPVGLPGLGTPLRVICGELIAAGTLRCHLAMDGDPAGREATMRIAEGLSAHGIKPHVLLMPKDKDLSDCLSSFPSLEARTDWLAHLLAGHPYRVGEKVNA